MLITLAVAVGVMAVVALPYLRSGSRILTPGGERVVERAKVQAKQKPVAAAGSTWHGLVALRQRIARAWQPIGQRLHGALDRLEGRSAPTAQRPVEPTQSPPEGGSPPLGGARTVGRPRPIPVDSGPIPEIPDDGPQPPERRVIDLRESADADHPAGNARHAR